MTIMEEFMNAVEGGSMYTINLRTKTLTVGKKTLIKNGEWDNDKSLIDPQRDAFNTAEEYFYQYYNSVPSERSERHKHYFAAKDLKDMDELDLAFGENREVSRARLEAYILCCILCGYLKWDAPSKYWFKKSDRYTNFILLKEWFN